MDAEKLNQAQTDKMALQEAVYLVDRAVLLYLKEVQSGDFEYAVFDKQTKGKVTEGRIMEDNVLDGIDPTTTIWRRHGMPLLRRPVWTVLRQHRWV